MKIPYLALRIQLVSPPPAVALPCQKKWHVTATKTENTLAARLKKPKLELGFLLGFILLRISGSLVGGLEHCHLFFGLFSPEPGHPDGLSGFMRVLRRIGMWGFGANAGRFLAGLFGPARGRYPAPMAFVARATRFNWSKPKSFKSPVLGSKGQSSVQTPPWLLQMLIQSISS